MYLIRNVFQAKPGKAKDLVQVFKKAGEVDQDLLTSPAPGGTFSCINRT